MSGAVFTKTDCKHLDSLGFQNFYAGDSVGEGSRNQVGRGWEPKDLSLNCISIARTWALFRWHVYRKSHSGYASEIWLMEGGSVILPLKAKCHSCWDYSRKIRAAKTLLIFMIFFFIGVHSPCSLHSLFNTGFIFSFYQALFTALLNLPAGL